MKKWLIIAGIASVVITGALTAYYFFSIKNVPQPEDPQVETPKTEGVAQIPVISSSPEVTPKVLILPVAYKLTDGEKKYIAESGYTLIYSIGGDRADSFSPNIRQISVADSGEYKSCTGTSSTTETGSTTTLYTKKYISKGNCSIENSILPYKELSCDLKNSSCQTTFLELVHGDTTLYMPQSPLIQTFPEPNIDTKNANGLVISYWKAPLPYGLVQRAYSVEYLDLAGKRLGATGLIENGTMGDFFLPTKQLETQQLTVKLRTWYTVAGVKIATPKVITKLHTYTYEISAAPTTTRSTAPVEMAWIPDWGMEIGTESVKANPKKWQTLSPVWFTPNRNGTLNKEPTYNNAALVSLIKKNGIKLVPTISLFDADILKDILRNDLDDHVSEIISIVSKNNYDGIDLDYESTYADDKDLLISFVTKLADGLHKRGKTLVFTALPKIDDREIYAYLPQTHIAQDWKAIGAVVDEFRIMAYDFTGQGSKQPGSLSPMAWNELLIQYATANMPAEKVVLALPLYAHGWPKPTTTNIAGSNNDKSLSSGALKNTISPQHDDIVYISRNSTYYRESMDPWYKEMRADFKYKGVERVMYYLNKKSMTERLDLAKKYGIKGICYWRIGGELL
jgi:spore germination protein YaaH